MNTERFTGRAELYDTYRPGYPDSMFDYIYENLIDTDADIADIGAGTGILSEGFLKRGSDVYCVEPNSDMRDALVNRLFDIDGFVLVEGTAEDTLLGDNSVDLVTAAQAFHWFDTAAFFKESKRILRKGGSIAIIYNKRDENSALTKEAMALSEQFGPSPVRNETINETLNTLVKDGWTFKTFKNNISVNAEGFVGDMLSSSHAPLKGEAGYEEYVRELKKLFGKFENGGRLTIPYNTGIYHCAF
jgi:ubiquinone/menaquinone biosynthesis C-methylase UbiE